MNIDYDGISLARESELHSSARRLVSALIDAMRDGEIPTVTIETCWVICDYCRGDGGHSHRFGAITADDWSEWDDDSRASYLSGRYDETCELCKGTGKVRELDEELLPSEVQEYIQGYRQDAHDSAMERYYERLAGC